ncbi:HAMP domain-containing histidine kinase [bacterium]|nr:HAMP domain-containing histidine kinase [bacterium]
MEKGLNRRQNRVAGLGVPKRHMVIFILLSIFAVAQVTWWVIFQVNISDREEMGQMKLWHQQIQTANHYVHDHFESTAQLETWLKANFPDLELSDSRHGIVVTDEARQRLHERTHNTRNMFIHEGIVFTLLLMAGILYLYRTLRKEVAIERHQANFLAAISHELKTPITALRLYLDTLIDRDLPKERETEIKGVMRENLDRLQNLIEKLLQARAMVNVKGQHQLEITELGGETEHVVTTFREERHDLAKFDLTLSLPDYPLFVRLDSEQWRQVLLNLLDNAVKYSKGHANIEVTLRQVKKRAILTVRDQGIGFASSERKHIFVRFYRAGNEDTRLAEGSGVGLYLVSEIAKNHRGKAYAFSEGQGKGATFTVELPIAKEKNAG